MELSSPTNTSSATFKNEAENETTTLIQPPKPLSFSNGVLKRLHHHHHHAVVVTYKECLKNHAAAIGGHAIDGCGEFMAANNTNPNDPTTLICAACGCHRNFHRRDPENPITSPPPSTTIPALEYHPHHRHHPPPPPPPPPPLDHNSGDHSSPSSASPPPISSSYYPPPPHMLLSLTSGSLHGGGGLFSGDPKSENNKNSPPPHMIFSLTGGGGGGYTGGRGLFSGHPKSENNKNSPISAPDPNSNSRKRFRTKFTQDQKEKMVEFAEKVGWRFQKKDEPLITRTCNEIGIEKGVLKVWMHNNKNTLAKKDHNFNAENGNGFGGNEYQHHLHSQEDGGDTSNSNNGGRSLNQLHQILSSTNNGILGTHVVATTTATTVNGSSSS